MENLLSGRVAVALAEVIVDSNPLRCAAKATGLESLAEFSVIKRNGDHQTAEFLRPGRVRKKFSRTSSRSQLPAGSYFDIVRTLDSPVNYLIN